MIVSWYSCFNLRNSKHKYLKLIFRLRWRSLIEDSVKWFIEKKILNSPTGDSNVVPSIFFSSFICRNTKILAELVEKLQSEKQTLLLKKVLKISSAHLLMLWASGLFDLTGALLIRCFRPPAVEVFYYWMQIP